MYYGNIKNPSIENGPGIRLSLFVSGCRNNCPYCFSPQTHDFKYGKEFTKDTQDEIISMMNNFYTRGITILGGEPLEPENQGEVLNLILRIRNELPDKDIWVYSGFLYEEIYKGANGSRSYTETSKKIIENIDVLVDGKFDNELKDISLVFRGSSNQRIINVKETLNNNKIILFELEQ